MYVKSNCLKVQAEHVILAAFFVCGECSHSFMTEEPLTYPLVPIMHVLLPSIQSKLSICARISLDCARSHFDWFPARQF